MRTKLYLLLVTAGFITSCEEILIGPAVSNDPISNFEAMWKSYDQYYGLFEPKEVDWQATYNQYRPMINEQTTDDQLKSIFHAMIDPLDDNHTYIITTENEPRIESGIFDTLKVQTDFSLDLIPSYVNDFTHYGAAIDYGTLADNIGYIHLGDFIPSRKYFEDALDQIIGKLKNTDGLVIDIRDNPGGNDAAAQYVAGRFAAERKLYMNVRKKSGPGPNDFTQAIPWHVEPTGGTRYTKSIVLLTSRWTQSAGETFTLAMQELANVTQLGDFTSGAFSDNIARELPNGWFCFMSIGDYRAADGKSYEGIGVKPDMWIVNSKQDIQSGKDRTLEKALELL
ncbi:MAG: S41 family peptidase [Saprospiraceae bacterium]|nr:S41 family peptidase [Saprospiraceae bacterium]